MDKIKEAYSCIWGDHPTYEQDQDGEYLDKACEVIKRWSVEEMMTFAQYKNYLRGA